MTQRQVTVIGGGPSGMMAAIAAARCGASVRLLEKERRPGTKLLLTGNGKCNLSNTDPHLTVRYHSDSLKEVPAFTASAFETLGPEQTIRLFEEMGLLCTVREQSAGKFRMLTAAGAPEPEIMEGYVYPASGQSSSVLSVLNAEMERLNVRVKCSNQVDALKRETDGTWSVTVNGYTFLTDAIVLCCGSASRPSAGGSGSGYDLARSCGHSVTPVHPALTGLTSDSPFLADTGSVRVLGSVRLAASSGKGDPVRFCSELERGEVQLGNNYISGIPIFQISRYVHELKEGGLTVCVCLDLLPDQTAEETQLRLAQLADYYRPSPVAAAWAGLFPSQVLKALLRQLQLAPGTPAADAAAAMTRLCRQIMIEVNSVRGFEQAQVCAGGVDPREVRPDTLESRIAPGLYLAGELLDIDGPCGGYNLQWAWSSGYLAGMAAAGGRS